ncbi:TonB-dependent receptor [Arcicella sp. LKC2W]|uniref:SusC/RagA family TonB-linked outer membrane protein n=1 Tax=Arcicella sp. LKC2W TaxID=2984198 RepID=UPI002B1FA35B|nr:TonB-dependent receptor [Arcicella sp. LKC2W]MEA5461454.1 TonB-dependent receptor [Arcicella sp. LKC2W]
MNKKLLMIIGILFMTVFQIVAQERVITGKVISSEDGSALPGVSVTVKGTTRGVTTDATGSYKISVPNTAKLAFSFVGYTAQDVAIGAKTEINVVMRSSALDLEEVVVVGYGTQSRTKSTHAVSSVKGDSFKDAPVTGLDQAMQGRAPGVFVSSNSGTPGGGVNVRVRAPSSIGGSSEPLYVIDGIVINTGSYSQLGFGGQSTNSLSDISPSDIESIDVLKDAAAAAIYGARAANGVVLITTKKGKAGKTQLSFNYSTGYGQKNTKNLKGISGAEEVKLLQDMIINRYGVINSTGGLTTPDASFGTGASVWASPADAAAYWYQSGSDATVDATGKLVVIEDPKNVTQNIRTKAIFADPSKALSTNWQDEVFRTAPMNQYELSARGGNDKTTFFVSANLLNQKGILVGSDFSRLGGRINLDHQLNKKVKFKSSLFYGYTKQNRINNDNNIYGVLSAAILLASDIPVRNADGSYGKDVLSSVENPVAGAYEPYNLSSGSRLLGSVGTEIDIFEGLKFTSTWNIDQISFKEDRFLPSILNAAAPPTNGSGAATSGGLLNWTTNNYFNYNKTLGGIHNFALTVGADYQQSEQDFVLASGTGFPGNSIKRVSAAATKTDAQSFGTSYGFVSYYGRLNYTLDDKYTIQGVFRADASSRFGGANTWGYFPSISGSWRVSKEKFMESIPVVSDLKLRASYGVTGNSEINNFAARGLLGGGAFYQGQGGLNPTQLANPDLSWEETKTAEIGLDLALLKNRVRVSAGYYNRLTDKLLLAATIPATSGFTSVFQNIGEMENKGFEFSLGADIFKTQDFTWTADFNIAANQNKVLKIFNGVATPFGFSSWLAEGEALGSFRAFKVEKIFQTQAEIDALDEAARAKFGATARYQNALTRPGDIKFVDINGDGRVTTDDQAILGSAQPTFFGGFRNNLTYKGFDLDIFFQFVGGNKMLNYSRVFSEGMNGVFGQTEAVLNRWTPTNTNTDVPRAVWGDPNQNRRNSDRFIEDGSYARLKNLTLGYTIPKTIVSKIKLDKIRVYVTGQNLLTFTNYKGMDPEVSAFSQGQNGNSTANAAAGTDFLTFPQPRTFIFGVNIGF